MQKDLMYEEYWLVNSNKSKVKRFHKKKQNKDKFFEYIFIDSGKISGVFGQQHPVMNIREELKIKKARESKKLLAHGWRRTKVVW